MNARPTAPDEVRRFILEDQPVRGHWVRLDAAWRELRSHNDYPPAVRDLLGQAVTASVLLAATLKFEGTLTLQLRGPGAVHLLVAQCTHDFRVRAVARFEGDVELGEETGRFRRLVGDEGRLVVTIEANGRDNRYQGIVPLSGESFAESLEAYFASSEQLPTRVVLAADESSAVGLLVQKLPGRRADGSDSDSEDAQAAWNAAHASVDSVDDTELLGASAEEALTRSFAQQQLRLYRGSPVQFACRCSPERVANLLRSLGEEEVREVLREQGAVTVTCEFCDRPYRFESEAVEALFASIH